MKFSGEFSYEKSFSWLNGTYTGSSGKTELDLLIEVMGDSDFGVTRGWLDLIFCLDSENCEDGDIGIDEIGISIGNTTVLATGSGASIWNDDDDELLTALLGLELSEGDTDQTGGVYVSLTHDLGNGWSVAKAIECIDSCEEGGPGFVGVVSYDNNGITGHVSVLFANDGAIELETIHAGIGAEMDNLTFQAAFAYIAWSGEIQANASIAATLDIVTLAGGFAYSNDASGGGNPDWVASFSAEFDAGDFTIAKAFIFDDDFDWIFAAEVSTDLSDTLSLTVGFQLGDSTYDGGFYSGEADAIAGWNQDDWKVYKELTWTPGGGYEATAKAEFGNTNGNNYFELGGETSLEF
jgi:hypothetical protein